MKFVCLIRGSRHIRLGLPDHLKFFQERFVFQRDTVGYFHGSPQEGLKGNLLPLKIGLRIGIPYFCDWKLGRFRRTSLIRQMWFISYWACCHFGFL